MNWAPAHAQSSLAPTADGTFHFAYKHGGTETSQRLLNVLAGDGAVTFQVFCDRKDQEGTGPQPTWFHGTLVEKRELLERLNAEGAGVFVMVNEGDGKGRSAPNVTRVRAVFIDTDGVPFPSNLPLKPHLVVG